VTTVTLASQLSQPDEGCPIPFTHDRLAEAHYFIHQVLDNYHHPHPFRFSLSAFLQAARSVTWMLQSELSERSAFTEWYAERRQRMSEDEDFRRLNELRVSVTHRSSLVPGSSTWVGLFKHGRPAAGRGDLTNPFRESFEILLSARRHLTGYVHPHRAWIGEELGLRRHWALTELPDRELAAFCISVWEKLAAIVSEAHTWLGARYTPSASCKHGIEDVTFLVESDVFPEVERAWSGSPTEEILPRDEELPLLAEPWDGAEVWHVVQQPAVATGWVGGQSPWWPPEYCSMLLFSIADREIAENTGVFFRCRDALVRPAQASEGDSEFI
jgi:hypothetical protein